MTPSRPARLALAATVGLSLLTACAAPGGTPAAPTPQLALPAMPPGTLTSPASVPAVAAGVVSGLVAAFDGHRFVPVAGAIVALEDGTLTTRTDDAGRYELVGVAPGTQRLVVRQAGFAEARTAFRLSTLLGTPRVNVALAPPRSGGPRFGLRQLAPADAVITGVVADPRGSALGGATVKATSNAANNKAGGSASATADGFYAVTLPQVAASAQAVGQALLQAYGTSPGGVRLEATTLASVVLNGQPLYVKGLDADGFTLPAAPVPSGPAYTPSGTIARCQVADLSSRLDEFYLRVSAGGHTLDILPDAVAAGLVTYRVPFALNAKTYTVQVVPFGAADRLSPASSTFVARYDAADLEADLAYRPDSALRDATSNAGTLNAGRFVGGDVARYALTIENANPLVSPDLVLSGRVVGAAGIAAARVDGVAVAAADIGQPDAAGNWTLANFSAPLAGTAAIEIDFAAPAVMAQGAAVGVDALRVSMPSIAATKATAPGAPAALVAANVAPAGVTLAKAVGDDGVPNNGRGVVVLTLAPVGATATGGFRVVDRTMTDQATATGEILPVLAPAGALIAATQPGGTNWAIRPDATGGAVQNADGSVSAAFWIEPPAAFVGADGYATPITITYVIEKGTGLPLTLGGGASPLGAVAPRFNLGAPFTDASLDQALPGAIAADPPAVSGL